MNKGLDSIKIEDKLILINYFRDENKKDFLLKIFEEAYDYFINNVLVSLILNESIITFYLDEIKITLDQLSSKVSFEEITKIKNDLTKNKNKDYDKKTIYDYKVFFQFLEEFKKEKNNIKNINHILNIKIKCKKEENDESIFNYINKAVIEGYIKFNRPIPEDIKNKLQKLIKVDILSTLKSSETIKSYDEIIMKLSNGYFIARTGKSYWILNNSFIEKCSINIGKIKYISERINNNNKGKIQLMAISKKNFYICEYNIENNNIDNMIQDFKNYDKIYELNITDFIISKEETFFCLKNLFSKAFENQKENSIKYDKIEGLINDNLKYFDFRTKINNIKGYNFNYSKNNLILNNKNGGNSLLISSCIKDNQNWILIKFKNQKEKFIHTFNFKAICFYPVSEDEFYAGGYENGGKIKLYNVNYISCSIKCNPKSDKTIKGGEITYLLKIENKELWYFQDNNISSIEI